MLPPDPMTRLVSRLTLFVLLAVSVLAQGRFRGGRGFGGGESYIPDDTRTAREVASHSTGTPNWTNPRGFERDVFTFVRVKRNRREFGYGGYGGGGPWTTDAPDSDLNLSYRLQQM